MSVSPNTYAEALKVAQREAERPSQDWTGYCQKFVRTTYGIPSFFGSAWAQWNGLDDEDRFVGGSPDDAPLGAALFYKGSGPYGHIVLAGRPFGSGASACWSNDLVRSGSIDKVHRSAAVTAWGQKYLGYGTSLNNYDLRLREAKPPKPKQDKPYQAINRAVENLESALKTAQAQKDRADIRVLRAEIRSLKRAYSIMRRY